MPDIKFKNTEIYFSILNPSDSNYPLFVPRIDNPKFATTDNIPGIVQLIEGDLGITEKILKPIIDPITKMYSESPILSESFATANNIDPNDTTAINQKLLDNYIPKDTGLKAIEKTIISSMMESYKPLMDFVKVFVEMFSEAEDIHCKFLASHIKLLGKEIGIKSRNPLFWQEDLNYTETITHSLQKFLEATEKANSVYDKSMSDKNPIKNNLPNNSGESGEGSDNQLAYYIGYFDNEGNSIDPPKWVKDSNKWFRKEIVNEDGIKSVIGSPFEQLNPDLNEGVKQVDDSNQKKIDSLNREKIKMLKTIDRRIKEAEKIENKQLRENELKVLDSEKEMSKEMFDSIISSMNDIFNGTNKEKSNYIDDTDISKGVNPPANVSNWIARVKSSQLRQKYYPEQQSTIQKYVNRFGKEKPPYIKIPKATINYKGRNIQVEVPLAFPDQISTSKVRSNNRFFDKAKLDKKGFYSNRREIRGIDIFQGTSNKVPYLNNNRTYFSHNMKNNYVPDNVKNFYLPLEWEEVFEYAVRNKRTKEIVKTVKEVIPFKIDIENDYELRVIQVVNKPLNKSDLKNDFFTQSNIDSIDSSYNLNIVEYAATLAEQKNKENKSLASRLEKAKENPSNILKYETVDKYDPEILKEAFYSVTNIEALLKDNHTNEFGTLFNDNNTIPEKYNLDNPTNTKHSTDDINPNNLLKEGIIYHGLDPRYTDIKKHEVFWLVEAIKKDEDKEASINNGKNKREEENNKTGKEWYGLVDSFTAIPQVVSKLIPLIVGKAIPLLVKIIQLISNPTKIKDLMLSIGLTDDSISKFPQIFTPFSKKELDKTKKTSNEPIAKDFDTYEKNKSNKEENNFVYDAPQIDSEEEFPKQKSLLDGTGTAEFGKGAFGKALFTFGVKLEQGEVETVNKAKEKQTDFNKPPEENEQALFSSILNFIKIPFEIMFKIFKWIIDWIKKLLNPSKIASAMEEFFSFKWIMDIIGKDSILGILGIPNIDINSIRDKMKNSYGDEAQLNYDNLITALRNGDQNYIEVLIYDILVNGKKIKQEKVERPYTGSVDGLDNSENGNNGNENDDSGMNDGCGERDFDINKMFPIPLMGELPKYNKCELPQIYLKPLEMIVGNLNLIQEFLNGLIGMPISILGLEPTIPIPKFGKEIPFANLLEDVLNELKERTSMIET